MKAAAKVPLAAFLAVVVLALSPGAQAQESPSDFEEHLSESDRGRIARFDEALGRATVQAVKGAAIEDLAALQTAIGGETLPMPEGPLLGDWRCRTIKIGGNLPLVVYTFFDCRIERGADGLRLVKLSGSQRNSGRLFELSGDAWGYAGALHYADEAQKSYGADPERNMVGRLVRNGADRMWLGLPEPAVESIFDVLEMVRE